MIINWPKVKMSSTRCCNGPKCKKLKGCEYFCKAVSVSSEEESAHLEHHPVLLLRLLNHTHVAPHGDGWQGTTDPAGPQTEVRFLRQYSLSVAVGKPHPHSQGVVVCNTSPLQSDTQLIHSREGHSLIGCVTVPLSFVVLTRWKLFYLQIFSMEICVLIGRSLFTL